MQKKRNRKKIIFKKIFIFLKIKINIFLFNGVLKPYYKCYLLVFFLNT